jgi:thiol-disulfide isomerase/thioredoxin
MRYFNNLYITSILFSLFFCCSTSLNGQSIGNLAPDFQVQHKDGYNISFQSLRGKYIYLNFWASWCPVSTIQVPNLLSLYDKYNRIGFKEASGFEIMSISLDEKREEWENVLKSYLEIWKFHCISPAGFNSPIAQLYRVNELPTSFFIDPQGYILMRDPSFAQLDDFLSEHAIAAQAAPLPSINNPNANRSLVTFYSPDNNNSSSHNNTITASADDYVIYNAPQYNTLYNKPENNSYTSPKNQTISGEYRLWLGTFGKPNFHNFEKLNDIGEISAIATADNKFENVYVGYYESHDEAEIALQKVKHKGYVQAKIVSKNYIQTETTKQTSTPSTYSNYTPNNTYTPNNNYSNSTTPTYYNSQNYGNTLPQSVQAPIGVSETYVSYSSKPYSAPNIARVYTPNNPTNYNQTSTTQKPATYSPNTNSYTPNNPTNYNQSTTQASTTQKPATYSPNTNTYTPNNPTNYNQSTTQTSTTQKPATYSPNTNNYTPNNPTNYNQSTTQPSTTQKPATYSPNTNNYTPNNPTNYNQSTTQTSTTQKPATYSPNTYTPNNPTNYNPSTTQTSTTQKPAVSTKPTTNAPPPNKDPNVWTIRPSGANPSEAPTNPTTTNATSPQPATPEPVSWVQRLEQRGLNKQQMSNLPSAQKLRKEQEKLRKKRQKLMREVELLKKQEDSLEEQIQFRNMYE